VGDQGQSTRRDALRTAGGGAVLALLGLAGISEAARARSATPAAGEESATEYAIARIRTVKPEFSAAELARVVNEGFLPIVQTVPGFIAYFVLANDAARTWVSIGVFTDKAAADESTRRAIEFGRQGTHDWVDGDPIIVEGPIDPASTVM